MGDAKKSALNKLEAAEQEEDTRGVMGVLRHPLLRYQRSKKVKRATEALSQTVATGRSWSWSLSKKAGNVLWIAGTTALVLVVPLILEIEREQMHLQLEQLQVKELQAQGRSLEEIAAMGFASARPEAPSVSL